VAGSAASTQSAESVAPAPATTNVGPAATNVGAAAGQLANTGGGPEPLLPATLGALLALVGVALTKPKELIRRLMR
jgi:hypothetical protein